MNIMDIIIWGCQCYVAYFFIQPAIMKFKSSKEKLVELGLIPPKGQVFPIRILAILELLGSVGIILPWALGIYKILTPLAAMGLSLVMSGAIIFNFRKKSYHSIPKLTITFILCLIIAWYRYLSVY